jgi:hypothetical protein
MQILGFTVPQIPLFVPVYAIVIILMFLIWFFKPVGRKMPVRLFRYINGTRYYWKTVTARIRKRNKEFDEEMLFVPLGGNLKAWTDLPSDKCYIPDSKGHLILDYVVDPFNDLHPIEHEPLLSEYQDRQYKEKIFDKDNKPVMETVYIRDENNELVLEPKLDLNGNQMMDSEGKPIFKPKTEQVQKTRILTRQERIVIGKDLLTVTSDRNWLQIKMIENREKWKLEKKEGFWSKYGGLAIVAVLIIATCYMSYQHIKQIDDTAQAKQIEFMDKFTKTLVENPSAFNPLSKPQQGAKAGDTSPNPNP